MQSHNKSFIELIIKCHEGDKEAIDEHENTKWKTLKNQIEFDDDFIDCMNKLSHNGNEYALNIMGLIFECGCGTITRNIDKAIEFYERAIQKNLSASMNNLAMLLEELCDVGHDERIKELYQKAIELGDTSAMINYGLTLTKQNKFIEAANLFMKANKKDKFNHALYCSINDERSDFDVHIFINILNDPKLMDIYEGKLPKNIMIWKTIIQHFNREQLKTILLTKTKIPKEVINEEILSKVYL